jgi:hypothetical protein
MLKSMVELAMTGQEFIYMCILITEPARFQCLTSRPRRISKSLRAANVWRRLNEPNHSLCRECLFTPWRKNPHSSCYLRLEMS